MNADTERRSNRAQKQSFLHDGNPRWTGGPFGLHPGHEPSGISAASTQQPCSAGSEYPPPRSRCTASIPAITHAARSAVMQGRRERCLLLCTWREETRFACRPCSPSYRDRNSGRPAHASDSSRALDDSCPALNNQDLVLFDESWRDDELMTNVVRPRI